MTHTGPAGTVSIPNADTFWLTEARVPRCFLDSDRAFIVEDEDDLVLVDILVSGGKIKRVEPTGSGKRDGEATANVMGGQIWPCFVDMHTHIDKGHIWPRQSNPDGSFDGALESVARDRAANWGVEDVRARMAFSLRCAYAHGTRALRTHLDSSPPQHSISWPIFSELREIWADRIELQAVSIIGIDAFGLGDGEEIVDCVAEHGGILGAVTYPEPNLGKRLRWTFEQAGTRGLDLDFHVDETLDPSSRTLETIAETALETGYDGTVTCGHCCSLSVQADADRERILDKVAAANLAIVSLPMCNMYLQDRSRGRTPRTRGVTLLHELKARGVRVSIASDNTRDPFYGYGDLDCLEVFTQAARIAHLDRPVDDWPRTITDVPASVMGLKAPARITPGLAADLVLFNGRGYSELLSRPQRDRVVLRSGVSIETTPPDYRELDHLMKGGVQ